MTPTGRTFTQDANGLIVAEAENATSQFTGPIREWVEVANAQASSSKLLQILPDGGTTYNYASSHGPWIEFTLSFNRTGDHYVWVRGFSGGSGSNNVFSVWGGQEVLHTNVFAGALFEWVLLRTITVASTGEAALRFKMRQDGFVLDKIVVTSDASYDPQDINGGLGPFESGDDGGGGDGGDTGGPVVAIVHVPPDAVQAQELRIPFTIDANEQIVLSEINFNLTPAIVPQPSFSGLGIEFTLAEAGYVTLVVDDISGTRVRNVIQNTFFAAGTHRVYWDGYDEGEPTNVVDGAYDILRSRVSPGTYHARLLYHRGISLNYEFSVQSPGTPAWHTSDRTGAWLSDHGAPADALFLPTYRGGSMLFCSDPAETGHGVMYLDMTGRKIQGMDHISNNLNYPVALARDAGPQADSAYLAWAAMVRQAKLKVLYFQTSNGRPGSTQYATGLDATTIYGIAAYNNRLVVSYDGKLTFINGTNAKSGNYTITNTVTLDNARGVTTDGTYLYILVGSQLRRYSVNWLAGTISGATTLASGLSDPKRVRLANNLLYVSDHGSSHQVKVYNLSGTLTRTIGQAGGPQEGVYNEQRMAEPLGVDVDSSGKLWVAEGHYMPKRISRWNAGSGAFEKAWYGPPKYGGGLFINPVDKTRAYYSGQGTGVIEFNLNWTTGESKPSRILLNRSVSSLGPRATRRGSDSPNRFVVVNGRLYGFTPGWSQSHATIYEEMGIWVEQGNVLRWKAQILTKGQWANVLDNEADYPDIYAYVQANWANKEPLVVWSDMNNDGEVQLSELTFFDTPTADPRFFLDENLTIWISDGYVLPVRSITSAGVPVYHVDDLQRPNTVTGGTAGQIAAGDGYLITTHGPIAGWRDGVRRWHYHSQWPRRAKGAPIGRFEGDLIRTTRVLSGPLTVADGDAGSVWALNSEHGEVYLFTGDGYYVATLLADTRNNPLWRFPAGTIQRGDNIGRVSPNDEHFWPLLCKASDGNIYLTAGKEHSSILRVGGLENVQRIDLGQFTVTSGDLDGLPSTKTISKVAQTRKSMTVPILSGGAITVNGILTEWPAGAWVTINEALGIEGAIAVDNTYLYAAIRSSKPDILNNAGDDYTLLFATGGGIDICIGALGADPERDEPVQGDVRIFVTRAGANPLTGAVRAARYEQEASSTADSVFYESPVSSVTLERVTNISSQVQLAQSGGHYELRVPLSVVGISPSDGAKVLGDIGVLFGDGAETQFRAYYNNVTNMIVSDIPSEARLEPQYWAEITFDE